MVSVTTIVPSGVWLTIALAGACTVWPVLEVYVTTLGRLVVLVSASMFTCGIFFLCYLRPLNSKTAPRPRAAGNTQPGNALKAAVPLIASNLCW